MSTAAKYIVLFEAFCFLIGSKFELIIDHNRLIGNILIDKKISLCNLNIKYSNCKDLV